MGIPQLKVFGDSNIIIEWINGVSNLQVLEMDYWCTRIKALKHSFPCIECHHIYREHNVIVDGLSKEALQITMGHISLTEFMEGELNFPSSFMIFD